MKPLFLILIFSIPLFLLAQIEEPDRTNIRPVTAGYYINPHHILSGILLSDEKSQGLFILRNGDTIPSLFFNYPANYKNYSVSPNGNNIAFRKMEDGINYLVNYNIKSGKLQKVFTTKDFCSNISFTKMGKMAFSANKIAYIVSGVDSIKNQQEDKIIDMSISTDGSKLVIQIKKGKTRILDAETFKTIDNLPSYANSYKWSPDGKRLAFKKDFELHVWDSETKSEYNLGEGTGPSWSPDSKYVIFQRNTPIEMKFVNADLYISSFDAEEVHQITNTINRFEMQPIFISANEILYLTYEDRQIIRAGLSNFKLINEKVLFKVSK